MHVVRQGVAATERPARQAALLRRVRQTAGRLRPVATALHLRAHRYRRRVLCKTTAPASMPVKRLALDLPPVIAPHCRPVGFPTADAQIICAKYATPQPATALTIAPIHAPAASEHAAQNRNNVTLHTALTGVHRAHTATPPAAFHSLTAAAVRHRNAAALVGVRPTLILEAGRRL